MLLISFAAEKHGGIAILFHFTISFFRGFFKPFTRFSPAFLHILQLSKKAPPGHAGRLMFLFAYSMTSSTGQWSEPITSGWMQALCSRSVSFSEAMK